MLLLTNGTIATMDPARPMAEAAVVDGAYFAYVGGRADARGLRPPLFQGSLGDSGPPGPLCNARLQ